MGQYAELWQQCKDIEQRRHVQIQRRNATRSKQPIATNKQQQQQQNISYAIKLAKQGYLKKSTQALTSQGVAPLNEQTHALFRGKLVPGKPVPELPGAYDTLKCDVDLLTTSIKY